MSKSVVITREASLLAALHACRYNEGAYGLLLGSISGNEVTITRVLPVSHSVPVGPIFEMSATFAEANVTDGESVVGAYISTGLPVKGSFAQVLAKGLENVSKSAVILSFNTEGLEKESSPLFLAEDVTGKTMKLSTRLSGPSLLASLSAAVRASKALSVIDFEEVLETGANSDPFNAELLTVLSSMA